MGLRLLKSLGYRCAVVLPFLLSFLHAASCLPEGVETTFAGSNTTTVSTNTTEAPSRYQGWASYGIRVIFPAVACVVLGLGMWIAWAKRRHENRRRRRDNQYEVPEHARTAEHHDEMGSSPDGLPIALNNFEYIQMEEQPSPRPSPRTFALSYSSDPCTDYTADEEPKRSIQYNVTTNSSLLCDLGLSTGWYRFTSAAGGEMPTTCPPQFACGTHEPMWLNGTHPVVGDGEVNRTVCVHQLDLSRSDCCGLQIDIWVRNCSGFYVYYLTSPPGCDMAYCAAAPNNPGGLTNTAAVIVPVLCIVFMLLFLGGGLILYKGKRYGHERSVHVSPSPVRRKYSVPTIDE
ncbi:OIT3 [Branchiostoma lanceolatum]|uniref:OIT3 protein n=1 Tax=Branchiostoma lanceolatum TaxID=7740 RepID=A0A8K0EDK5_BRALA|nr:OIT3 [Branchiostoma lanceolatum]